jgi:hypothetical protein
MKRTLIVVAMASVLVCLQCREEGSKKFLIGKDTIGALQKNSTTDALETLFPEDSVVRDSSTINLGGVGNRIRIYEKGGALLLTLLPAGDSLGHIENVRIEDPRYHTAEGVGLGSSFGNIKEHFAIRKIVTSRNNIVIFPRETDLYFTIGREELPASLRYNTEVQIEAVQIPDKAKVKYLMAGWEH